MIFYPYALLLHIVGVLGMFIAVGLEQAVLFRLRAAKTTTLVREWLRVMSVVEKMFPVASVLILGAGLYMVFTTWGWSQAWIDVSLGVFLLTSAMAPTVTSPRFKAMHKASETAPEGPLTGELWQLTHDSTLLTTVFIMDFLTVGVVFLMTIKPGWIAALTIILVAFVAAIVAARKLGAARPSSIALRRAG
jgi:ABC-type antimicrobial peptide transport system permease subunit